MINFTMCLRIRNLHMCVFFSQELLASSLLLVNIYPYEAIDLDEGIYYTMRHHTVSKT